MTIIETTYGLGGHDADHPNGNIVEHVIDNGDGTCDVVTFDSKGKPVSAERLEHEKAPEPGPTDIERLAAVLVDTTDMTDEAAAKALGVDRERLAKARERNAEAATAEAAER